MTQTLYVINPNSLERVTEGIDRALDGLRALPGLPIECLTLKEGPPGIQTQRDADSTITPLGTLVERLEDSAAGFVIACFSDPGLHSVRERTRKPVLGIGESGMLAAFMRGQRIGVIAVAATSIPRHLRYFGAMGLSARLANERAVGFTVAEVADPALSLAKMISTGKQLRDEDGADVLVMGCAGMAQMRRPLEDACGLPVIEPCQATVGMAIGRLLADKA
ncbi:Asp/Glu racemase [Pigmentiphaga aceris]|uniref:Asp/Glu racemase n=1 Tax=Pigmentiphaga aceris TaxID=1940612 RepID=A0A5C0AS79_9BURK|nr:aspartate/glutamate racemase family protein [Pigmentiphaga aceris]QEI05079.1 Asp/Glu racemase [Pigmentiphaga aceris]